MTGRGKGFHVSPPSMHEHANRVGQRADQVSGTSGKAQSAGLHGSALGEVGESSTGASQRLAGTLSRAVQQTGSKLQRHAGLVHTQADGLTDTDSQHAGRLRAIHPGAPSSGTRPTGSGSTSGTRPSGGARPPVAPKPPHLRPNAGQSQGRPQGRPYQRPPWMGTDANGWPTTSGRPAPTVFNPQSNTNPYTGRPENYQSRVDANGNQWVTVHRFADNDGGNGQMWQSPHRYDSGGDHAMPAAGELNDQAQHQVRFGRNTDGSVDNPFVSVTTDPNALQQHGEPWAQQVVGNSSHLGTFEVPAGSLFRPSVTSATTRNEQEWLFHDGQGSLSDYGNVTDNPYRTS